MEGTCLCKAVAVKVNDDNLFGEQRRGHICHCKNFSKVASIIEPCIFGPNPGPFGPCTSDEINQFGGMGGKYCAFWNQTANDAIQGKFTGSAPTCLARGIVNGKPRPGPGVPQ